MIIIKYMIPELQLEMKVKSARIKKIIYELEIGMTSENGIIDIPTLRSEVELEVDFPIKIK